MYEQGRWGWDLSTLVSLQQHEQACKIRVLGGL